MSLSDFMILPVLDLLDGKVVHGRAGKRREYQPLVPDSRPVHVARLLLQRYPAVFRDFYVADLDALQGGHTQHRELRQLLHELPSIRLWVDAGFATPSAILRFIEALGSEFAKRLTPIVASETLRSWKELASIVSACGSRQIVFSLDLAQGRVRGAAADVENTPPQEIIQQVAAVGIRRVIVLDVATVGIRQGVSTVDLCHQIHDLQPTLQLFTGGGVRTVTDLTRIRDAGCAGALVATALHDGTLTAAELTEFISAGTR